MDSIILQTGATDVTDGVTIGRLGFAASSETGADARLVVAKIEAVAEEDFDADSNATEMVFYLAAGDAAVSRMTLSSAGTATLTGNLIIADVGNIGSASDPDAIAIAADGVVSFSAANICPTTSDGTALGTGSKMWSDLFLADGSVINFNNGDITLTHASNTLTLDGGSLVVSPAQGDLATFTRTNAGNVFVTIDATTFGNEDEEAQLKLKTGIKGDSRIYFGDPDDIDRGCICYDHGDVTNSAKPEEMRIKTGTYGATDGSAVAITIDTNQTTTFNGSINQYIRSGATEPEDGTVTIDLSEGNYYLVTLGAEVTNLVFTNGSDGQRFLIRFTQPAGANYAVSCWDGGSEVTHVAELQDQDNGGSAANVTVKWAGGITPTMTRTNTKADTYGFIINDENAFDAFIVGQSI